MVTDFKIKNKNIVFFDGKCNLCSNSINFILNNEINSNFFYDILSNNRYKWFGKKTICYVPRKDISSRFLED